MAVSDAQIRAVLAANANASDERLLKALANYGVTPERFTAVTGRTLNAMPSYANMTDAEMYAAMAGYQAPTPVYQQPASTQTPVTKQPISEPINGGYPAPSNNQALGTGITGAEAEPAPVKSALNSVVQNQETTVAAQSPQQVLKTQLQEYTPIKQMIGSMEATPTKTQAPRTTASGIPYSQIKTALAANPNATSDQIAKAMINYGATPDDMRRVLGQSFEGNTAIRQAYGQAGGFTDQQVRDAVMGRAGGQGFATQSEIQKAAQNYGITPEQLARVFPQVQPQSLNQAPIVTEQTGLMPAISAIGRAADVTQQTTNEAEQKLINRIKQVGQAVGGIYDEGQAYQQPYRELGQQAAQRQAALTGALGPEAQAQAFAEYQASPALDYLQQQSERALTRQAAALGGLGGGNVRQDLVKLTADLYGQDYANQFARLGEIAQRGYGASGLSTQLSGQEAGTIAGLGQSGATTAAQMQDALAGRLGNILGTEAQYRMRAGENIANAIAAGTNQISGLQVGASDAYRNIYGNLTDAQLQTAKDLATQYGNAVANQYLAQANLYQGQGSALAGVPGPTYTPVPGYSLGNALMAGGQAYDMANTLFNTQQQNPSGYQFGGKMIPSGGNTGGGINYSTMYGF